LKKIISYLLLIPVLAATTLFLISPITQANTPLTCNMSTVTGDDDGSFPMTLPFSLQLGNANYNQIYYSTNGLMSFGRPDGNFWSYPSTPSLTVAGRDWVSFGPGAYTSYGYNQDSFCIEWSVRPFPQSSGDLTQIRLVVNVFPNGGWHGEITTLGWIPPDIRRGIVWEENGTPLPIEAAFDVNGGVPVEVEPAPAPTSFTEPPAIPTQCWDGSTIYAPAVCPIEPSPTPTPEPSPTNSLEPSPIASPEPQPSESQTPTTEPTPQPSEPSPQPSETVVQPSESPSEPSETFSPTPTPSESELVVPEPLPSQTQSPEPEPSSPLELAPSPEESPTPDPSPEATDLPSNNDNIDGLTAEEEAALNELLTEYGPMDAISFESFEESGLDYEDLPPDQPVMLENGVILTAEVADAIEMFEDPSELLLTVFTDPGKALKAFANVGADMTPEQRKESQTVVVASIIVGQVIASTNLITGRIR
jgi:hypothetical protein